MKNKYIILDEIGLKLFSDFKGKVIVFESEDEAKKCADKMIDGWRIIAIPFGE